MITFFTTAKPFTGHNGIIQRNALKSWTLAAPNAEVILFGDEAGAVEAARELGITHVAEVERVPEGPKKLRSFFDAAQKMARYDTLDSEKCDMLLREFLAGGEKNAAGAKKLFFGAGGGGEKDVPEP